MASRRPASPWAQDHSGHGAPADRLGTVTFQNSCADAVKPGVNRGVALLHSFWFDEAIRTFNDVAAKDPACGLSQWGVALAMWGNILAAGPPPAGITQALAAIEKGRTMGLPTPRERDYLEAVSAFYVGAPQADARTRKVAYEKAMEKVAATYPDDVDATIFYAMSLTGTQLPSDKSYANLIKAANLLDPLFAKMPDHPGLAHYIIHAYDVPPLAPRALDAARAYAKIAPDAPHALHMPSHTFTRLGYWDESIDSNIRGGCRREEGEVARRRAARVRLPHLRLSAVGARQRRAPHHGDGRRPRRRTLRRRRWGRATCRRLRAAVSGHMRSPRFLRATRWSAASGARPRPSSRCLARRRTFRR